MSQLHKRFLSDQIKDLFDRSLQNEIERKYIQEVLEIKKSRFSKPLKEYRENSADFTIQYHNPGAAG